MYVQYMRVAFMDLWKGSLTPLTSEASTASQLLKHPQQVEWSVPPWNFGGYQTMKSTKRWKHTNLQA